MTLFFEAERAAFRTQPSLEAGALTAQVPAAARRGEAFCAAESVAPSFWKSQAQLVGLPVEEWR